jgi:release factor glutamine methyltransferase
VSATETWTVRRVLDWAAADLRTRGNDTPRLDAELLLGRVLSETRVGLIVQSERPLSKEELAEYKALHQRRRAEEPIAYILGAREFYGRTFRVDRRVLVPRPDTETLVRVALDRSAPVSLAARALDLCTGSGCVAITLARERPTWGVLGTDVSEDALTVARENAVRLAAVPRVFFRQADLFEGLRGRFDVITANPPYIRDDESTELAPTILDFEPHVALFGGADGLDLARRIIEVAPKHLQPGGVLALEIGAGQADATAELLERRGFVAIEKTRDYGGIERVVSGLAPASPSK